MASEETTEVDDTVPNRQDAQRRMTVAEAGKKAQEAYALALAHDDQLDAHAQRLERMGEQLSTALSRVDEVAQRGEGDPVSLTLAEDALADQIDAAIDRKNTALLARLEQAERTAGDALASVSRVVAETVERADTEADREILLGEVRQLIDGRLGEALHEVHQTINEAHQAIARLRAAGSGIRHTTEQDVTPTRGAVCKVLELMRHVTVIAKEKEANLGQGGRFKFRGVDDAMDAVGHAMREVGLVLSTRIKSSSHTQNPITRTYVERGQEKTTTVVWTTAVVEVEYTFIDPTDGSVHRFEMVGEGRDASDKSTSKATSMAIKYGLFQALMIPVTGLDDADAAPPQVMEQAPTATTRAETPLAGRSAHEADPHAMPHPPASPAPSSASKTERAQQALAAMRAIDRHPADQRRAALGRIRDAIEQEGLAAFEVDGATLRAHGIAVARTLGDGGEQ